MTFTVSPTSLFRNARPIGEVVEIRPLAASASSGMTSWKTSLSPVVSTTWSVEPMPLLGRGVFGVFTQIAQLARPLDLLGQLQLQLAIKRLDFILELLDQPL